MKHLKLNRLMPYALSAFLLSVIIYSCKKSQNLTPDNLTPDQTAIQMREWLSKQKTDTLISYAAKTLMNAADWKTAHTVSGDSDKIYQIVPLPGTTIFDDPAKTQQLYLVLTKKNANITANIYEIFGNRSDLNGYVDQAITNFNSSDIAKFTGQVTLSTWNNAFILSKVFENGKNTRYSRLEARNDNTKVIQSNDKKVNGCVRWYIVTYDHDTGDVLDITYAYTICDGNCEAFASRSSKGTFSVKFSCGSNPGGGGGPGGGNGDNCPVSNAINGRGVNFIQDPCASTTIINRIRDSCLNAALAEMLSSGNLNGKISGILSDVFGSSDNVNLTFNDNTNDPNKAPAQTTSSYSGNVFNAAVSLNLAKVQGSSQEFATIIMIHETLHAYLDYNNVYKTQLAQHQEIAEKYVEDIKSYVQQLYPIDDSTAYAIIMNGLGDIFRGSLPAYYDTLKTKYHVDDPLSIYEFQRTGQTGTICKP